MRYQTVNKSIQQENDRRELDRSILLDEAVALARILHEKILNAEVAHLNAVFAGVSHFDGNDGVALAGALRAKIEEYRDHGARS